MTCTAKNIFDYNDRTIWPMFPVNDHPRPICRHYTLLHVTTYYRTMVVFSSISTGTFRHSGVTGMCQDRLIIRHCANPGAECSQSMPLFSGTIVVFNCRMHHDSVLGYVNLTCYGFERVQFEGLLHKMTRRRFTQQLTDYAIEIYRFENLRSNVTRNTYKSNAIQ